MQQHTKKVSVDMQAIEYLEDYGDYESENEKEDEEFTPVLSGYSNLELPFLS